MTAARIIGVFVAVVGGAVLGAFFESSGIITEGAYWALYGAVWGAVVVVAGSITGGKGASHE